MRFLKLHLASEDHRFSSQIVLPRGKVRLDFFVSDENTCGNVIEHVAALVTTSRVYPISEYRPNLKYIILT